MKDLKDPSLKNICALVILLHFLGILISVFIDSSKTQIPLNQPLKKEQFVVQTISLSSPSQVQTMPPLISEMTLKEDEEEVHHVPVLPEEPKEELVVQNVSKEEAVVREPEIKKPEVKKPEEAKKTEIKKIIPKTEAIKKPEKKTEIEKKPEVKKVPVVLSPVKKSPVKPPVKAEEKKPLALKTDLKSKQEKQKNDKAIAKADLEKKQKLEEQKKKNDADQKLREAEALAEKKRQQKLFSEVQERIAKIDESRHKGTSGSLKNEKLAEAHTIKSLQTDAITADPKAPPLSHKEISYHNELVGYLKLNLRLPEYGDVKLKLTINRSGKVVSLVIVSTESIANRKYIEKKLPTLKLPGFGSNFGSDPEYTFSITLTSE